MSHYPHITIITTICVSNARSEVRASARKISSLLSRVTNEPHGKERKRVRACEKRSKKRRGVSPHSHYPHYVQCTVQSTAREACLSMRRARVQQIITNHYPSFSLHTLSACAKESSPPARRCVRHTHTHATQKGREKAGRRAEEEERVNRKDEGARVQKRHLSIIFCCKESSLRTRQKA